MLAQVTAKRAGDPFLSHSLYQ